MKLLKKIKKQLLNNKVTIFFIAFLIFLMFYFSSQFSFYLERDMKNFEDKYYLKFSIILSSIVIFICLVIDLVKKRKNVLFKNLFKNIIQCLFVFYILNFVVIGSILFLNKLIDKETLTEKYIIIRITEEYITAYNLKNKSDIIDDETKKIIPDYNSKSKISENDTLTLKFKRGIFGLKYLER